VLPLCQAVGRGLTKPYLPLGPESPDVTVGHRLDSVFAVHQSSVPAAFRGEAGRLSQAMATVTGPEWDLPTGCPPWRVRDLLAHVRVVIAWLPGLLAAPAPERAEVNARQYYRPDHRFAPETNAARIALAQDQAALLADPEQLLADFTATWQRADQLCRAEPEGRVLRTRHGDAMLLPEFLLTRVVELSVHGLDLALALGRDPWLTPPAADLVEELLAGPGTSTRLALGWDQPTFLRKATGRDPIGAVEAEWVERLGLTWLTLG
jgi:uncharacterized protein (TIGR03083 family)